MTVVRIAITKKLTGKAYHYRQSKDGSFVSEYLVRTDAPLFDPQLRAYALNLATAESRLYPSCVRFDSANVKLATPGASAEKLRGQYSHVGFDNLWGQFVMAEEDLLGVSGCDRCLYPPSAVGTQWQIAVALRDDRSGVESLRAQARDAVALSKAQRT